MSWGGGECELGRWGSREEESRKVVSWEKDKPGRSQSQEEEDREADRGRDRS